MRLAVFVLLVMLVGCAHYYPSSIDGLKAEGYQKAEIAHVTESGQRVESEPCQVWLKEIQDEGRRFHVCIVPQTTGGGYAWRASALMNDKEVWSYDSGTGSSQPALRAGISCRTTDPLPDGPVSWSFGYVYFH